MDAAFLSAGCVGISSSAHTRRGLRSPTWRSSDVRSSTSVCTYESQFLTPFPSVASRRLTRDVDRGHRHCTQHSFVQRQRQRQRRFTCRSLFQSSGARRLFNPFGSSSTEDTRKGVTFTPPTPSESDSDADEGATAALSLTVSVTPSMSGVAAEEWDACAVDAAGGPARANPFVSHAFLKCLEDSRSAVKEEGWMPMHLVARDQTNDVVGVMPLYLKTHSYGEYVFDRSWASAYTRYGGSYYPKLQSCVPFTPVTGPRLLVREGAQRQAVVSGLCQALKHVANEYGVSSVHVTFPHESDWKAMAQHSFLQRMGMQYHWTNNNYQSFNDFLMDLKQSKRKNIRQERKKVLAQGLKLHRLRGADIKAHHWDSFYRFYRNTTDQKWGQAYLTRDFFHQLGESMGDAVLLVVAEEEGGRMVGGALNLVGGDALYGRNWGCLPGKDFPYLHFEACYYQAIEGAIEMGLSRVEAGAQGEHKIQRGYLPTPTFSAHYIVDTDFRAAVADFLRRETGQVQYALAVLDHEVTPFKKSGAA